MFDDLLHELEPTLDIPYPQRTRVLRELEGDLWSHYSALRDRGLSEGEARDETLRNLGLDAEALASLQAIHSPAIRRILSRLPEPAREPVEWVCAGLPLLATLYLLLLEVPMLDFMRQGGAAMWMILLIGGAGLFLQLHRAFAWFVVRDHSERSLARATSTPLYLAAAAVVVSIGGTATGFRVVLHRWSEGMFDGDVAILGFIEALSCVILGTTLAALIILIQCGLHAGLRAIQARSAS